MAYETLPPINLQDLIKPAGEAPREDRYTFLITGGTGNGKTTSISTIPESDKGLLLDFDGKSRIVSELAPTKIDIVDLKFDLNDHRRQLSITEKFYELDNLIPLTEKYQWLFVDGLTNFYALGCQSAHDNCEGKGRFKLNYDKMDYVDDWTAKKLQRWSAYFKYLVLYCHEDFRESGGGEIRVLPLARKRLSQSLPGNFQEIYHATCFGTLEEAYYGWITKPEELYSNTSSIPNLPALVPNNFDLLLGTNWKAEGFNVSEAITGYEEKTGRKITGFRQTAKPFKKPSN